MDSWNPLTPASFAVDEIVPASKLNTELRDRMQALFNGLVGDGSADADIIQRGKSGTLALRPAAGNASRTYFATDFGVLYLDNGSQWRIVGHDDFLCDWLFDDFHLGTGELGTGTLSIWEQYLTGSGEIGLSSGASSEVGLVTGATLNSYATLLSYAGWDKIRVPAELGWRAAVTPTNNTAVLGLVDATDKTTVNNGIFFNKASGAGEAGWIGRVRDGGVDTDTAASGLLAGAKANLRIEIPSGTIARFFVNDSQLGGDIAIPAGLTEALRVMMRVTNTVASAKQMNVDMVYFASKRV